MSDEPPPDADAAREAYALRPSPQLAADLRAAYERSMPERGDGPPSDSVFVIEPEWASSPYGSNSTDRGKVLDEAKRRWGGKKDDWKIEGVARLEDSDAE